MTGIYLLDSKTELGTSPNQVLTKCMLSVHSLVNIFEMFISSLRSAKVLSVGEQGLLENLVTETDRTEIF